MPISESEKNRLLQKYGSWAVVTGASSGIGRELTERLAEAGFKLVITARRADTLHELAQHLQTTFQTQVKVVVADMATPEGISQLIQSTHGLPVGMLVVSAGYGTSGLFTDTSLHAELNMIQVNCEALLSLTHHYSQQFVQQKRGGIILMSSMVAFQGVPYAANYAATKAYVQSLAEGLAVELAPYGVDILAAAPGPVESGFGQRAHMKMSLFLTPKQVGIPILKALGRRTTVLPGLLTKILVYALRTVPRWGKVRIMATIMRGMTQHQRV